MSEISTRWVDHFDRLGVYSDILLSKHGVTNNDLHGNGDHTVVDFNPYHNEAVYPHIMMVRDEALKLKKDPILETLALLHDVGKPFQRWFNKEDKKVRFSGHEYASALLSINYLKKYHPDDMLMMLKVICFHIMGLKGENIYEWEEDPRTLQYLKWLNIADNKGRIPSEDYIKEVDETYPQWQPIKRDVHCNNTGKEFTLLIGVPGSGKSTIGKKMDGVYVSTDDMLEDIAYNEHGIFDNYELAFKTLSEKKVNWVQKAVDNAISELKWGNSVVFDATNMTKKKRVAIARRARKEKAVIRYVMVWRDLTDCMNSRDESTGKYISPKVYRRMMQSFTFPKYEEYDHLEHLIL